MDPSDRMDRYKIPWDDPEFSQRMLREHLSQRYDSASRRKSLIKKHVKWIHEFILSGVPSRILDLGCGPGLYTQNLAEKGHSCAGIDFSPASIMYARRQAELAGLSCQYQREDLRIASYGNEFDLVMHVFSDLNTFEICDANLILKKSYESLRIGGTFLIEVPSFDEVEQLGNQPAIWYSEKRGLFSREPYICLTEAYWDEENAIAIERYFILEGTSQEIHQYINTTHAYKEEQYIEMLGANGFRNIKFHPSMTGSKEPQLDGMLVITGRK